MLGVDRIEVLQTVEQRRLRPDIRRDIRREREIGQIGSGGGDVWGSVETAKEGVRLRDIAEIARRDLAP